MTSFDSPTDNASLPAWIRRLRLPRLDDIVALLMITVLLVMPALALAAADWLLALNIVLPTIVLSVLFGYFLAQSRYDELFALIVSATYGVVTVFLVAALAQPAGLFDSTAIVIERTLIWLVDAATGGINQDSLVFSMVVALLFWFFGYNAVWHIIRLDRVWRVIIPPAMILLVNMVIYSGEANLDGYLLLFVFMALMLIVRSNLEAREWDWYVNGVQVPQRLGAQFMGAGVILSLLALLLAWSIPTDNLQNRLENFQRFLASQPVRQVTEFANRLVEPIESEGPATADYYGGDSLNLGGAIQLGDQIVLLADVETTYRYYWRSRVFERYQGGRWTPSATRRIRDPNAPLDLDLSSELIGGARVQITQEMTMGIPSRLFYAAPQPLSVDQAGTIDAYRTTGDQDDADSPVNVSVMRPLSVLERGESYAVTSAMSVATANDLRTAGTDYPSWVSNPNAYAGGINPRVADLAQRIVTNANAINPYDQAKAIETWLRTEITYNEQIPRPPQGVDSVEWFLFERQEGYCTYYATAMIQMLRSLGVPARMAAGFSQGEFDPSVGQFVVRERDAHTWVEVYFPGYGWVEFEPTAAEAPLTREGDSSPVPQQTNPLDEADAEPTQTPTPLPSPTPLASPSPDPSQPPPQSQATMTPTPSPTPTVTPVIVPTEAPPVQPPDPPAQDFLSFLLPALGIALLIFFSMLLLVLLGLFIYWWWEWRGMGGLSPVARAYARLERYLPLIGIRSREDETPDERRRAIIRQLPQAERPVTHITRSYTVERYSNRPPADDDVSEQRADNAWQDARGSIIRRWLRRIIPFLRE